MKSNRRGNAGSPAHHYGELWPHLLFRTTAGELSPLKCLFVSAYKLHRRPPIPTATAITIPHTALFFSPSLTFYIRLFSPCKFSWMAQYLLILFGLVLAALPSCLTLWFGWRNAGKKNGFAMWSDDATVIQPESSPCLPRNPALGALASEVLSLWGHTDKIWKSKKRSHFADTVQKETDVCFYIQCIFQVILICSVYKIYDLRISDWAHH